MKWLLAFDASTPRCVVAVGRVSAEQHELVVADEDEDGPNQASVRLFVRIEGALSRAGIDRDELAAIAHSPSALGPGRGWADPSSPASMS